MIHVVEFPEQGRAKAWFAFELQDFVRKVYAGDPRKEWEIFDVVTPRELLETLGSTPDAGGVREKFPAICGLADQYGWDTPLYRADYLLGPGMFQTEAVNEIEACVAALEQRMKTCRIYWSDSEATAAFEGDPIFDGDYRAHEALREQLVALEILEGPYG